MGVLPGGPGGEGGEVRLRGERGGVSLPRLPALRQLVQGVVLHVTLVDGSLARRNGPGEVAASHQLGNGPGEVATSH